MPQLGETVYVKWNTNGIPVYQTLPFGGNIPYGAQQLDKASWITGLQDLIKVAQNQVKNGLPPGYSGATYNQQSVNDFQSMINTALAGGGVHDPNYRDPSFKQFNPDGQPTEANFTPAARAEADKNLAALADLKAKGLPLQTVASLANPPSAATSLAAPPTATGLAMPPAATTTPNVYTIQKGDNLSTIAKNNGTTVAEIMKLNPGITNPNLIYAGRPLNLPPKAGGQGTDFSQVTNAEQANQAINSGQTSDAASKTASEAPPVKKTTADYLKELKENVTPTGQAPAAPNYTQALTDYRTEYGVVALENQLNDLKAQEADILAIKKQRTDAERGKTVAMSVISGRITEVERQENERLTIIQNSINTATNQLNTKYNVINSLMKTKEMDYTSGVAAYDKQFSNNIALYNAAKGLEEADKTEADRMADNARANAQIIIGSMNERGLKYSELSQAEQVTLGKLGVESGLGADFFKTVMEVSGGKDILTSITSADDTKVSIIYKDGTTKTIATGLPRKSTGSAPTVTESQIKVFYKQSMESELGKVRGSDGYISPQDWNTARQKWAANTPYGATDFDEAFRGYINPHNPYDYAGFEEYRKGFKK